MNLHNYKGIYFDDDNEKYTCPVTGAHFRFEEMCRLLEPIRISRGDPKVDFEAHHRAVNRVRLDTEESQNDIPNEILVTEQVPPKKKIPS